MTKLKNLVIHPFIFGILPVMLCVSEAKNHCLWEEALSAVVGVELFVAAMFLIAWAILRDARKAGLVASLGVILCFCYRLFTFVFHPVFKAVFGAFPDGWVDLLVFFVPVFGLMFIVVQDKWVLGKKTVQLDHDALCIGLDLVALVMLIINGTPLVLYYIEETKLENQCVADFHKLGDKTTVNGNAAVKPDIYYILLDEYVNTQTLKNYWVSTTASSSTS